MANLGRRNVKFLHNVSMSSGNGSPISGESGTGAGTAGPGSLYIDANAGAMYINKGTKNSPIWNLVGADTRFGAASGGLAGEPLTLPGVKPGDELNSVRVFDTSSATYDLVLGDLRDETTITAQDTIVIEDVSTIGKQVVVAWSSV